MELIKSFFKDFKIPQSSVVTKECIKGIEFQYELLEKIPCTFNDGDMDFKGYCNTIHVFYPKDFNDEMELYLNITPCENKRYHSDILGNFKDENSMLTQRVTKLGDLKSEMLKSVEKSIFLMAYSDYVDRYKTENIKNLFLEIKKLEKEYNSEENRTVEDIKACYFDDYILSIWEDEKYNRETGEGWCSFEGFLYSFIENNIIHGN